jgi:hypothetical protein
MGADCGDTQKDVAPKTTRPKAQKTPGEGGKTMKINRIAEMLRVFEKMEVRRFEIEADKLRVFCGEVDICLKAIDEAFAECHIIDDDGTIFKGKVRIDNLELILFAWESGFGSNYVRKTRITLETISMRMKNACVTGDSSKLCVTEDHVCCHIEPQGVEIYRGCEKVSSINFQATDGFTDAMIDQFLSWLAG